MRAWMVRAGASGDREKFALTEGRTVAGWEEVPSLENATKREHIRSIVAESYPDESNYVIGNWTGQLDRFVSKMHIGDLIIMPSKLEDGKFALGVVKSNYEYLAENEPGFRHTRRVEWKRPNLEKQILQHDLRASIGSLLTVCELERNSAARRFNHILLHGSDPGPVGKDSALPETLEELPDAAPVTTSIRSLLSIAGFHRRTSGTVSALQDQLAELGLSTTPPFDEGLIDDEIIIRNIAAEEDTSTAADLDTATAPSTRRTTAGSSSVTHPVSAVPSATREPDSVSSGDKLSFAQTIMLENNYSQLAVVDNGALRGALTWTSIAIAGLKKTPQIVADALIDSPPIIHLHQNVLDVVDLVEQQGYVFVLDEAQQIGGIITISDLAQEFGRDRRPIMLIEEVELRLRRATQKHLTDADVESSPARVSKLKDLTLGSYPFLLQNEALWQKLGWVGVEQDRVLSLTRLTANVRNQLMHFSQDPLEGDQIEPVERLLRILRIIDREPPSKS